MLPGPESKSSRVEPTSMRAAQLLRFKEGTQVPEPIIVADVVPIFLCRQADPGFGLNLVHNPADDPVVVFMIDKRF